MKKEKKAFQHLIKSVDFFGHEPTLYYIKDDNKRQSIPGGVCSIMIMIYMILFVLTNLSKVGSFKSSSIK